jgi:multidrug efflux pump subunit AcrA (membrane-fusion protein)
LVDLSRAYLILNLPADLVADLQPGQSVTLQFGPERNLQKPGTVDFISPVVDPASGLRKVKMLFVNDPPRVEPGRVGFWITGENTHD